VVLIFIILKLSEKVRNGMKNMEKISVYGYALNSTSLYREQMHGTVAANNPASVIRRLLSERLVFNFSLSLVFVILMWLSANSFFYLPFTPVPVTMQVFTVLFASFALGPVWSFISQVQYILLGIAGAPLFAGFKSGLAALAGPSGGYIAGFAVSSIAAGAIFMFWSNFTKNRAPNSCSSACPFKDNTTAVFLTSLTSLLIIYSFGYMHLAGIMLTFNNGFINSGNTFLKAFNLGILPFILFDMLKIMGVLALQKIYHKQARQEK